MARKVDGTFEGDLVRPLGLMTLYFGYAEYELDSFLERLAAATLLPGSWSQRPIGQKLGLLTEAIHNLDECVHLELNVLLAEGRALLEQRNTLVHGCIVGSGRVISGRTSVKEIRTSPTELTSLAERAFSWKERMWAFRWKRIEPLLAEAFGAAPSNKLLERTREK